MTSSLPSVRTSGLVQLADYQPGDTFGPRRLVDHEFVWLLDGSAVWTVEDRLGASEPVERGLGPRTVALARAGTVDSYRWDRDRPSTHAYLHFAVGDAADLPDPALWPATRAMAASPLIEGICGHLLELAGQQSDVARARSDQLIGLLLDVFVSAPADEPPSVPSHLLAVADHVRRVWSAQGLRIVEVAELSAAANVSSGHLHRLFREQYGCGPGHALELVRLARAATALQRSNATIAEVARLSGFANPYHLSRRFSAVYGVPPGAFRRLTPDADPMAPVRQAGLMAFAQVLHRSPR